MSAEPLWRQRTREVYDQNGQVDGMSSIVAWLECPVGTEVEVWPAGDHTPVTRDQIREAIYGQPVPSNGGPGWLGPATARVWALLHGTGDTDD